MTPEQKYELGIEIIAGMHSEIANQDMNYGRAETADGLTIDPECPPEYLESHKRGVELANKRIQKQAPFLADVVLKKLSEMGYSIKKKSILPPSICNGD